MQTTNERDMMHIKIIEFKVIIVIIIGQVVMMLLVCLYMFSQKAHRILAEA